MTTALWGAIPSPTGSSLSIGPLELRAYGLMIALGAQRRLDAGGSAADFLTTKVVAARFYAEQLLPVVRAQLGAVTAGKRDLFEVPTGSFSA